ncbi:MAG: Na(+)-translocating NADH-quinone reductase subunit A [Bacteroidota bacterium]
MPKYVKIRKGLNIKLQGEAEKVFIDLPFSKTYALKPPDFIGIKPKLLVNTGDVVKAGTPLFYDKDNEKVMFTSPVSGEVLEIHRGAKRKILEVKVLADKEISYVPFKKADPNDIGRENIIDAMLKSGVWALVRQRPFSTIANPADNPKAIFISAFDTNPLAPDNDFILHGKGEIFQTGLDAIAKLTSGKIHLNINADTTTSKVFTNSKKVEINEISGPHPAGNVGIQIHHIDPINKGDVVWYLSPQDVLIIGRLFLEGRFNASRIVALTGSEAKKRKYYKTMIGASIEEMIAGNPISDKPRYISGNVFTGTKIEADGYVGFYDTQVTVIPEGDEPEFFGWITPGLNKFSMSRTFLSWLMSNKKYSLNTNLHGEKRAFVVTGQYEKVLPMDIYPVQLIKSIIIGDIELMENLGIYEVSEEDFALCEFVCTSKINVQEIIRQGLDLVKREC